MGVVQTDTGEQLPPSRLSEGARDPGSTEIDTAIAQLVSGAVAAEGVIDVYAAPGIDKPELSIPSDEFLDRLASAERPNLQLEPSGPLALWRTGDDLGSRISTSWVMDFDG